MTTWRDEISATMKCHGETFKDIIKSTLTDGELNKRFNDGFGGIEGKPFTLWTKHRVYFPAVYDGSEWVSSVPRNPCSEITNHVGGE